LPTLLRDHPELMERSGIVRRAIQHALINGDGFGGIPRSPLRLRCGQCFANVFHAMCAAATVRRLAAHSHPAFVRRPAGRAPMIRPFAQDEAFLADLARPETHPDELRVWWLGQSGFLVRHAGDFLLFDPYLSDSLTRKYAQSDKPHVRLTERVIAPEKLTGISVVTSSHSHTDHLDAETLLPLRAANPEMRIVIPDANRAFVAERLRISAVEPVGLDDGTPAEVAGWTFHGIAAAHNELERDSAGHHKFLGYVVQRGGWTLYHSGDTRLYPGLVERLSAFAIDLAFLPINGHRPERRVAGNLDGRDAAQLAHKVGVRWVVPCHYEMFAFNTADPRELFLPECKRLGQPARVLHAGQGWSVPRATTA
jgi:L-ascorbate metabolism protein UlaG (beta-lactamase superfamily)